MSKIREFLLALLKDERGVVVGLVGVVAVAGWGLAAISIGSAGGLEQELRAAKAGLSVANVELAATREVQMGLQDANASLIDMSRQLDAERSEFADLTRKIGAAEVRLGKLRAEAKERQDLTADGALGYRTTARARVRAAPTTESQEVALMPAGTPLLVLDSVADGTWYKVGRVGFMHRDLLEPVSSEQSQ